MKNSLALETEEISRVEGVEIETNLMSFAVYWKSSMMAERLCGKAIREIGNCGINLVIIGDHGNKFTSFFFWDLFAIVALILCQNIFLFFMEHIFSCARNSILLTAKYFPHFFCMFYEYHIICYCCFQKNILNQTGMMFVMFAKRRVEPL